VGQSSRMRTGVVSVAALMLAGCTSGAPNNSSGTSPSGLTVAASTSTTAAGGRLVEVAGRRLYLECLGTGAPTLMLQSGYGNAGDIWSGTDAGPPPLAAGLATTNRACVYDRPGTIRTLDDNGAALTTPLPGRSEQTPMPRTGTEVVRELHTLLQTANVPGPYVLVGHSLGGLFDLLYARTYPEDVHSMVMVDATPPALLSLLPPDAQAALRSQLHSTSPVSGYPLESYDLDVLLKEIEAAPPFRPVPAVLLAAGTSQQVSDPAAAAMLAATEKVLPEARARFQAALPGSKLEVVADASHYIQVERPAVVIQAARSVSS
jgi:pimeloyl-ACP methyl ester carboxylesterase